MVIEVFLGLFALGFIYHVVSSRNKDYFKKLGIPQVDSFIVDLICSRKNANEIMKEHLKQVGNDCRVYGFSNPLGKTAMILDPELIRQICIKDFDHFVDRGGEFTKKFFSTNLETDLIWKNQLVNLFGEEWKEVRTTFSPIFTSGKMKGMMVFMKEVCNQLVADLGKNADEGKPVELKVTYGKLSMDTIASCAFGVNAESFTNENSQFVLNARNIFRRYLMDGMKFLAVLFIPFSIYIFRFFNIPVMKYRETKFFYDIVKSTLDHRISNPSHRRNDLVDLMVDAMKDEIKVNEADLDQFDEETKLDYRRKKGHLDEIVVVATAIIMLVAGYDTTGQTLSFALYELAKNEDVRKRLQEEVDEACEGLESDQLPDYKTVQGMEYLDMVVHETLRKYPALGFLQRGCTKDYTIPATPIKVKKGEDLMINVTGVHYNPKYYPDPEVFDPERFSKENRAARSPYTFLGFGVGPRACIGMRFALLEAKLAIVATLKNFNVVKCDLTPKITTLDPYSAMGACKEDLFVSVQRR